MVTDELKEIINEMSNNIVIITEISESKKSFNKTLELYYENIKKGFEVKEFRECPVYFKFSPDESELIHTLQFRHFITNLMFWEPIIAIGIELKLDESYIVDCTKISTRLISDYINEKIIKPYHTIVEAKTLNKVMDGLIYNLSRISLDFNMILGLSINAELFIDLANKNERFNEIIRTDIPDSMQPNEIESYLDGLTDEFIGILKTEENLLQPILSVGSGIKSGQLREFSINCGMKPGLDQKTIPIPINTNFMVGGLKNITNYYIDSLGGRKSLIMNKTVMGNSGHFNKKTILLASTVVLDKEIENCGTLHPVKINVKSRHYLKRFKGRYYRTLTSRNYKVLKGDEDYLIGKDIFVRSPITCASKNVCKMCYGDLYYINKDINSIGAYAAAIVTEPISQRILSSKHLLTTQSELVEFDDLFYKFFVINLNEIMVNSASDLDLSRYSLLLIKDNIEIIEEDDDDLIEFNKFVTIFHIKDKKTGEIYTIEEKNIKDLYISSDLNQYLKGRNSNKYYEIDLDKFDRDEVLFVVEISNNELTKPLYSIMYLLDNEKKRQGTKDIDSITQSMVELMIESDINIDSVHGEVLLRPLVRRKDSILERPDFTKYSAVSNYQILTISSALQNNPSVLIGLSFQYLSRQLINPLTFKKIEGSYIDVFFKERV